MKNPNLPFAVTKWTDIARAAVALGMEPEQFENIVAVIRCEWSRADGSDYSGYYELMPDGRFLCTVLNESEIFDNESVCREWLRSRVVRL